MLAIRPAILSDLDALVAIYISSWKTQFTPFLTPEQVKLKDLDPVSYSNVWQERFTIEEGQSRLTFMAELDGQPAGYITGRNASRPDEVELQQIYVLPEAHRNGIGQQLVSQLAGAYQQQGKNSLFVWVMTINPAIAFYRDRLGGEFVEERVIPHADGILKEAKFRWQNLGDLIV